MSGHLVERVVNARQRAFVGRAAELAGFDVVLAGGDPTSIVYVHGPGSGRPAAGR